MAKKCIICSEEASLAVKGTSDVYCNDCAEENFDDLSYLEKIEELERKEDKLNKNVEQVEDIDK